MRGVREAFHFHVSFSFSFSVKLPCLCIVTISYLFEQALLPFFLLLLLFLLDIIFSCNQREFSRA
jgi:hypothetical protein